MLVQQPNFFGCIEDADALATIAHDAGALLVAAFDPISLGLLKRPGDYGADIAVAEGHTLGTPMHYGGPYLGIMACREAARPPHAGPHRPAKPSIAAARRCFVLTLQTREQHIRREKATSNVCTNQGLFALRATIYLSLLGPQGLHETANLCLQKSRYCRRSNSAKTNASSWRSRADVQRIRHPRRENNVDELLDQALDAGFLAGVPLGRWYPELNDCFLVAVTEKRTKAEIDALVRTLTA